MTNNSKLYLSKTGSLYIKFMNTKSGRNVFRLMPVWPIENDLQGQDWFEKEIANGNVQPLAELTGMWGQKE